MGVGYKDLLNAKDTGSSVSVRDVVVKYLYYTPLFLVSLAVCFALAFLYIRNAVPKYIATATILVTNNQLTSESNDDKNGNGGGIDKGKIVIDNDVKRMQTPKLIRAVVLDGNYNLSYKLIGKIRQSDVYKATPFIVDSISIKDSNSTIQFSIGKMSGDGFEVKEESENETKPFDCKWNKLFTIGGSKFRLAPKQSSFDGKGKYMIEWAPVEVAVGRIIGDLSVQSPVNSRIELSLLNENLNEGKDIINDIVKEFRISNLLAIDSLVKQNDQKVAISLGIINDTIKTFDKSVSENNLGSLNQSAQAFQSQTELTKAQSDIENQQQSLNKAIEVVRAKQDQLISLPPAISALNPELSGYVKTFNDAQSQEIANAGKLGANADQSKILRQEKDRARSQIANSLNQLKIQLDQNYAVNQQRLNAINSEIQSFPEKDLKLKTLERKIDQSSGVYTLLYKNRLDMAVAAASMESNYKQLDSASGYGPVQPNKTTIYKFALLAGLFLPFAFLYLRDLLNDKIRTREDIMKRTAIPIIGELSHIRKFKRQVFAALQPGLTGEQFRIIRSNLTLLHKEKSKPVILVTSTVSGEGKSFISLNLAAVMAKSGKKIAMLEFDFRKPHDKNLGINDLKGLTDYLTGHANLSDIAVAVDEVPNLHIYPAGSFVDEPADILTDEKVPGLFQQLRNDYDSIIINSAPAGLVSDPVILGQYADNVLYVIRQNFSKKDQVGFIDDLFRTEKFTNMCILFNDVKTGVKQGYKGYGYVKGSPYYNRWKKGKKDHVTTGNVI